MLERELQRIRPGAAEAGTDNLQRHVFLPTHLACVTPTIRSRATVVWKLFRPRRSATAAILRLASELEKECGAVQLAAAGGSGRSDGAGLRRGHHRRRPQRADLRRLP